MRYAALLSLSLLVIGCGPVGPFPGGSLSGKVATDLPADWSFSDDEKNDTVDFGYRRRFEGCTPGYWKQEQHFDSWTSPLAPTADFTAPGFTSSPTVLTRISTRPGHAMEPIPPFGIERTRKLAVFA